MRRLSFALIEALIAIVVVGGALTFFLPAMNSVFHQYRQLKREITCQYLVDEYFANAFLKCVSGKLPEGCLDQEVIQESTVTYFYDTYDVKVVIGPDSSDTGKSEKRVLSFEVIVTFPDEKVQGATRGCIFPCIEKK